LNFELTAYWCLQNAPCMPAGHVHIPVSDETRNVIFSQLQPQMHFLKFERF
jgi:hypothetical protein